MYQSNTNKLPEIIQSIFLKLDNLHKHNPKQLKITNLWSSLIRRKTDWSESKKNKTSCFKS